MRSWPQKKRREQTVLTQVAYVFVELFQMLVQHGRKYFRYLRSFREREVDDAEATGHPVADGVPTAAGRAHSADQQHVLDVLQRLVLSVVPKLVVYPLTDQL